MVIYSKKNPPIGFYVYAYLRKDGTPYYIGKGHATRAWDNHKHHKPPKQNNRVVILECNLTDLGSLALERRYIKWYGRKDNNTGILMNQTDGGEGTAGSIKSYKWKQAMSERFKGDRNPMKRPEVRQKITGENHGMYGKTHTNEVRAGMKQRMMGSSNPMYGIKRPEVGLMAKEHAKIKVKCPHCDVIGSRNIMKRWHFDRCKSA